MNAAPEWKVVFSGQMQRETHGVPKVGHLHFGPLGHAMSPKTENGAFVINGATADLGLEGFEPSRPFRGRGF